MIPGFDPKFEDMTAYILDITSEIWEDRGIGPAIRRYYTEDSIVRHAMGITDGAEAVVSAVLQTLHEFPDRQLFGEDVIWRENGDHGYFASHRVMATAHHTGSGKFGQATGVPMRYRCIADTAIIDNKIYEEWLVRDNGAISKALGLSNQQMAEKLLREGDDGVFLPETDKFGTFKNIVDTDGPAARYAGVLNEIWNASTTGPIRDLYVRGATVELPSAELATGPQELDKFFISWMASFPKAKFQIENLVTQKDEGLPTRVSSRWTLRGIHEGYGAFGKPTGREIFVWGFSHAHMLKDKVIAEWITIDEVAVWKQILKGTIALEGQAPT